MSQAFPAAHHRDLLEFFNSEFRMVQRAGRFGHFEINPYGFLKVRMWYLSEQRGTYAVDLPHSGIRAYLQSREIPIVTPSKKRHFHDELPSPKTVPSSSTKRKQPLTLGGLSSGTPSMAIIRVRRLLCEQDLLPIMNRMTCCSLWPMTGASMKRWLCHNLWLIPALTSPCPQRQRSVADQK